MQKGPDVQRIKQQKRGKEIEPTALGMTRRRFLTYLGAGSAALTAGSAGVLTGCAQVQDEGATGGGAQEGGQEQGGSAGTGAEAFFKPIEPSDADDLILPEGYKYEIIRSSGDSLGGGMVYGDHNDYVAYFPIDALEGGDNSGDGLLWVNHEYINPMFWSGYTDVENETQKTSEQIAREKTGVGGSVVRVRREGDTWAFVEGDALNRRVDATTPMGVTGPAAGSPEMQMEGTDEVIGTLANCGGGVTPWNTVLTCEENFQDYFGERTEGQEEPGAGAEDDDAPEPYDVASGYRWLDDPDNAQPPEHYGWIAEVDPFDPESKPRKHTWLGRVRHENAAIVISPGGKAVVYTGHDENDQCMYKFISSGTYDESNREANLDLLSDGMLYVADFANGRWVAMDYENNPIFRDNGFKSQADVLVRTAEAAQLAEEEDGDPIGTPLDRCEDIEIDPETGEVYAALTNNTDHGNFYGQILKVIEAENDPEAMEFLFEVYSAGGPQTGFASPDNLAFDKGGNLWVVTDMSSSGLNEGIYKTFKNNGAFFMPRGTAGPGGDVFQFASGPIEAELTGPFFTPDEKTLFLAVQHPGEETEDPNAPTSTWPNGDGPKSSLVAITGF
ncbi:MAG: DUF839 domain-containing protein [Actinomycetota bacterium]|nr:DUF839 domain-containing protein [Actinomycetota bacterium]